MLSNLQFFDFLSISIIGLIALFFLFYYSKTKNSLQQKIAENNRNLQTIFDTVLDGIIISKKTSGEITMINKYFLETLEYTSEEVFGNNTLCLNLWSNLEERKNFIETLDKYGKIENLEISFMKKNNDKIMVLISSNIIILNNEEHIITVARNITDKKITEEQLLLNEKFLGDLIENSGALIYAKNLEGSYKLINKKWEEITGLSKNMVIGKTDKDLFSKEIAEDFLKTDLEVLSSGQIIEKEEVFEDSRGKRYFISIKFPTHNKANEINGICGISTDITERKKSEEQIKELLTQLEIERNYAQLNSITDALTDIYNRRHFDDTLRKEFFRLKRTGAPLSVIIFDIDYFKKYNDSYGHLEGDQCLKKISQKVKEIIKRETDTFARYGGEEFVVILPNTDSNGALKIAEEIRFEILNLNIPHETSTISKFVTVSLGVATVLKDNISSPEQIISLADVALYNAKEEGRNRVKIATINLVNSDNSSFLQLFWNKNNECGNNIIDEEHKHLLDTANKIIYAFTHSSDKDFCIKLIEELLKDISTHFYDEEIIFEKTSYPYTEHHKNLHKKLLEKATNFLNNYKSDKSNFGDLISFLVYDVVSQHLEIEDRTFFPYLNNDKTINN